MANQSLPLSMIISHFLELDRYLIGISGSSYLGRKAKAIPLQAWTGPEGFRRLRLPEFIENRQGCQPYAPAAFTSKEIFLVLISVRG
jgi:hypothetical protein